MRSFRREIESGQLDAESWSAAEVVRWGLEQFASRVAIASGFGPEGIVILEIASQTRLPFRVFTLDTDFLFPETHQLIDAIERRYGIRVARLRPALTPQQQAHQHGEALWNRDPDLCCRLRKVDPLKQALAGLYAWMTGIRRDQTLARANARKVDWDSRFGLVKLNPLADWKNEQVWEFIREHNLLYNPLHDLNYPSIGCTHCTRPIQIGEDLRAGRWSGYAKTECGLHVQG